MSEIVHLPMDRVVRDPDQPRKRFDGAELKALAKSIVENGLLQPVTVRPVGDKFMIVAGERRWRAHKLNRAKTIDAIVREGMDEKQLRNVQAMENMARSDMKPSEEANAIERAKSQGQTYREIARAFGRTERGVIDLHRLLKLPAPILRQVDDNAYPLGVAKLLSKFPPTLMAEAFSRTSGKSIAAATAVLREMEMEHQQTEIFKFTKDEQFVANRARALDALGAFLTVGKGLFAAHDDLSVFRRFVKNREETVAALKELRDQAGELIAVLEDA